MRGTLTLPDGYAGLCSIDLQKDKRLALLINGLALLIALPLVFLGNRIVPLRTLFSMDDGFGFYFLRLGMLTAGYAAYVVLHELVHGAAMKLCGTKKVRYGFCGMYAYAGSEDYYSRGAYIFIALAPVVLFLAVFAVANLLVPLSWFWTIYLLQIINVSGAAGDIYVTCRFLRMPKDILIKDVGTSMEVYQK